jgi:hypothetical protein
MTVVAADEVDKRQEIQFRLLANKRIEAQSALSWNRMGRIMKKAKKRAKSKTSSKRRVKSKASLKRASAKSKTRRTTKAKRPTKAKKSVLPKASTVKQVAKEAAVAAGLAAVGTALSAMKPEEKAAEKADGGSGTKNDTSKKRANP